MRLPARLRRRFKETVAQQEGGVAAHQTVDTMKEQTTHVGGGRQLADLCDVALPAQQRRGLERAVFAAVIDGIEPVPETLVQLVQMDSSALGSRSARNCSRTERKKRSILPRPSG